MTPRPSNSNPLLEKARDTLLAAQNAIPLVEAVDALQTELKAALERGYFSPEEEARIKTVFSQYLHVRNALHQTLNSLRPFLPRFGKQLEPASQQAFVASWLAGCMLMRSARFMVTRYHDQKLIRKLLNQPDLSYGIPQGIFDQIHKGSTHPATLLRYLRALQFSERHADALNSFADDPLTGPLLTALEKEQTYLETQKRQHAAAYAKCQVFRIRSKPSRQYHAVMWGLFEASGRAIAEMRNPFHRKRVRRQARKQLKEVMQPGDVLITRHDDAMSNLFLPGFWPHGAFVIGTAAQREALGTTYISDQKDRSQDPICILEAKKDGVRFRSIRETLAVDAFVLLRPKFASDTDRKTSIERALSHEGKLYDFEFDFNRSDRLVCTEVIYRSLDGLPGLQFELIRKAGRYTLPAEELMKQGIQKGSLEVLLCYGLKGNQMHRGERAQSLINRSLIP
ncbi:YiiX/YebB-like N1pC/P60 family cysteine hydrolase [Kiritimatiellaeota bacterium B1221]|nr:YiiX/YebB-like N1pC/P60 family cysteine hydrolase [Kiritimatiellaeota bacterium B1221]